MQEEIRRRTWEAPWAPDRGKGDAGYTVTEARKGKPGHGQYRNLHGTLEGGDGEAEKYRERERLPDADGESYQA